MSEYMNYTITCDICGDSDSFLSYYHVVDEEVTPWAEIDPEQGDCTRDGCDGHYIITSAIDADF